MASLLQVGDLVEPSGLGTGRSFPSVPHGEIRMHPNPVIPNPGHLEVIKSGRLAAPIDQIARLHRSGQRACDGLDRNDERGGLG